MPIETPNEQLRRAKREGDPVPNKQCYREFVFCCPSVIISNQTFKLNLGKSIDRAYTSHAKCYLRCPTLALGPNLAGEQRSLLLDILRSMVPDYCVDRRVDCQIDVHPHQRLHWVQN